MLYMGMRIQICVYINMCIYTYTYIYICMYTYRWAVFLFEELSVSFFGSAKLRDIRGLLWREAQKERQAMSRMEARFKGPGAKYLRTLVPNTIKSMVLVGPSGTGSLCFGFTRHLAVALSGISEVTHQHWALSPFGLFSKQLCG